MAWQGRVVNQQTGDILMPDYNQGGLKKVGNVRDVAAKYAREHGTNPDETYAKLMEIYTKYNWNPTQVDLLEGGKTWQEQNAKMQAEIDAYFKEYAEGRPMREITGQIQAFIDNLRGPLNNDPVYQQIAKQAINAAQAQAGRAGMSGRSGLAATNAAAVTQTTSAPYYAARQQALAGGLALQNQRDLGLGQLQAQKAALEAGLAKDTWAAQQNAAQGVGAAIGGGIGALGFIGGPALGAATMGAGAAIGGGLGGMVGAPQAPNFSSSMGRPSSRPGVNPYTGY